MALDSEAIDRIHTRLMVRYGARWLTLYAGLPADAIKRDWAEVLHGMTRAAVDHALDNLPSDQPPNAMQFRAVGLRRSEPQRAALQAPQVDRQRVIDAIGHLCGGRTQRDPRAWIPALIRRSAVERLSPCQQTMLQAGIDATGVGL